MTIPLRAWGLGRVALLCGAAVLLIETTATDQLSVPPFTHSLNGWSLVPPLVAVAMAEPLVDRSPELTALATRPAVSIALARLALAYAGALAVAAYCWWSPPEGRWVAPYVLTFLAAATVLVAAAGSWYWLPLLPGVFCWLQVSAADFPQWSDALPLALVGAAVGASVVLYVGACAIRDVARRCQ